MRRWTLRILVGLCGLIVVTAITGATYQWLATRKELAATPPPGRLVDIGGYRLHLWCTGDGAPAVILDTGLGGSTPGWGFVQPEVARFTRVCSYDRAGMGYSDPGPSPRTARRIASELAELLARSGIGGPVGARRGPPSRVSTSASSLPITLSAPPVSCSWMPPTKTMHMTCRGWRDLFLCCRRSGSSDCSACRSANPLNRWLQQCGSSRERRVSAQPDTRRRLTRLFTFGRARRKSGARAGSSPSLSSSSPVDEEPTRSGDSCNEIKPRCQHEDV